MDARPGLIPFDSLPPAGGEAQLPARWWETDGVPPGFLGRRCPGPCGGSQYLVRKGEEARDPGACEVCLAGGPELHDQKRARTRLEREATFTHPAERRILAALDSGAIRPPRRRYPDPQPRRGVLPPAPDEVESER
ncbi:MAG TPA: hypothetical protein VF746_13465 [Longimicrobium sp.]|jgi:hypothetical protein